MFNILKVAMFHLAIYRLQCYFLPLVYFAILQTVLPCLEFTQILEFIIDTLSKQNGYVKNTNFEFA